ncbi:MAG: hypothetical protein ACK5NB_13045 [Flavobacteriaceae bacterium]
MKKKYIIAITVLFLFVQCRYKNENHKTLETAQIENNKATQENFIEFDNNAKIIHVLVALCDNKYQGIVPVPKGIGNGQDPKNNLYWGAAYGVKTYFKRSTEWQLLKTQTRDSVILERLVFKHNTKNYYLVADAYNGKHIKQTTTDFLKSSAGILKDTLLVKNKTLGINGNAQLISYIGHDGLMDFTLTKKLANTDQKQRDIIILACYSKRFFQPHLKNANVNPLVWTTGLMAPEAYIIHDALSGYVNQDTNEQIRTRAAKAYSKYQKCSEKAARNLLVAN